MKTYTNTHEYFDDLRADVRKYIQNASKYTIIEIRDDLDKYAHKAIDAFYNDYEPEFYYRNYYNFQKKTIKKFYHNKNNFYYTGGIILSNEFMDDIYYRIRRSDGEKVGTLDQVYYSVIEAGYHGLPLIDTPRMAESPLEMIDKRYKYIESHFDKYKNNGRQKAKQETYNILFQ